MNNTKINIEIFCAPSCTRCGRTVKLVEDAIKSLDTSSVLWRKVNIIDEIDYAVELGIRATPATVINGELVFTASPDKNTLVQKIKEAM